MNTSKQSISLQSQILNKAQQVIDKRNYLSTCIEAHVCPLCGNHTFSKMSDEFGDEWSRPLQHCPSPSCKWIETW